MVSPFRGLQLISIISRKRCTQQLVMLHNISTFFPSLEHTEFKCKVGNDGNREDMSFKVSILGWCVEEIIFFSPEIHQKRTSKLGIVMQDLISAAAGFYCCWWLPSFTYIASSQKPCFQVSPANVCLLLAWDDVTILNKSLQSIRPLMRFW